MITLLSMALNRAEQLPGVALDFFLRALALGLVCGCVLWLLRVRSAALQYSAWRLVLFAMLMLPIASITKPQIGVTTRLYTRVASETQKFSPSLPGYLSPLSPKPAKPTKTTHTTVRPAETNRSPDSPVPWEFIALTSYLLVTGVMICRIWVGWLLIRRIARNMESFDDARLMERVDRQCERLRLPAFREVRGGASIATPMTFGWKNPVILLPADLPQWPTEKLDLVLAHELAHIRNGDYIIRMVSALNKSLYWFHPVSWWLDKRLSELSEHVSDDAALAACPFCHQRYVEVLTEFADVLGRSANRFRVGIAMSVSKLGDRRIRRALDSRRPLCSGLSLRQKLAVICSGVPLAILIASAQTAGGSPGSGSMDAQVVLSRRVYAGHGRTWRQLWIASSGSTDFRQLTHSARDHADPLCSRDGKLIYFVSDRDGARSLNAYAGSNGRELWAFDRQTGQERPVWQTSEDDGLGLNGTTADGGVLVRAGAELRSLSRLSRRPWRIDKVDGAAVSPDGRALAVVIAGSVDKEGQSHDAKLFIVDTATGQSRAQVGDYDGPAWSPDGTRIAAVADDGLAIIDVSTRKEIARVGWPKRDRPPEDLVWSPDEKYVLAGLYGEDGGAGDPQSDYFLLNIAAETWTPALTARQVIWFPGGSTLLYLRPFATTPLAQGSTHEVWTAQLAFFDLTARKGRDLTTGLVLNDYMTSCGPLKVER
jgi:beta-lactamase regulating signal transducer with metallopeptidase domain